MRTGLVVAPLLLTLLPPVFQQGVIRTTVVGVRLVVQVRSGAKPVTDLTARDFVVTDARVPQTVDAATLESDLAMSLLIDTSLSMRRGTFEAVVKASQQVIAGLGLDDRVAVLTASDHTSLLLPSTSDPKAWQRALESLPSQPAGYTPQTELWDGLMFAASEAAAADGVPVVLVVTDGKDNASWLSRIRGIHALARLGTVVDAIGVETAPGGPDWQPPGAPEFPDDITHESGGEYFGANDKNLAAKLKARFDELRSSYVLTYTPRGVKNDDGWHAVTVKVPNRNVTVKAQAGYYAGKYSPKP